MVERVTVTPAATALIEKLAAQHGPLMFHQSGGCCDGSAPMCYPRGEFRVGQRDVYLGAIAGVPVYISGPQFEYWQHTQLIIDAVPGRGSGLLAGGAGGAALPDALARLTPTRSSTSSSGWDRRRAGAEAMAVAQAD